MLFENFLKEIKTNRGLTINSHLNKITFDSGFIVAEKGVIIDTQNMCDETIINELKDSVSDIYEDGCKIGFWLNDNIIYIDIVHHYANFNTAKFFGLQWNQKAIFDCTTKTEISFPFN